MHAPGHNPALDDTPLSPFEGIVRRIREAAPRRVIPLHQGKTVYTTPVRWDSEEFPYPLYHDGPTGGADPLVEEIRRTLQAHLGEEIDPGRILVTNGITHGLGIVFHLLLQPGDEVLVLSPQWLFATGLVRAAHGVPVEVPFFPAVRGDPPGGVRNRLRASITPRTRAIYFNTPNNPTGCSLSAAQVGELVEAAREHGLWLVSDNAYQYYDYSADGFVEPSMLPGGGGAAFGAYSFSKTFGLTGYRIGYLLSPPAMMEAARKFGLYSIYSVSTIAQAAALSALRAGPGVLEEHRCFIRQSLELATGRLRVPSTRPDGGFYTLLDLTGWPGGSAAFIDRCLEHGVSLAPGEAFGAGVRDHARLCYSVVGHAELAEGVEIINHVYARGA